MIFVEGKDSGFMLDQNVGEVTLGNNSTSWLYLQTRRLSDLGVELTYSGDQLFLLRLIVGIDADYGTKCPSKMPK